MKNLIFVALFLPCLTNAQVRTKLSYTLPKGFSTHLAIYTSENDAPVWQGNAQPGHHTITVQTKTKGEGFIYLSTNRQSLSFSLNGKATDITKRLKIPYTDNDDLYGSATEIFPGIDKNFLAVSSAMQSLSFIPAVITDSAQARNKAVQYYGMLKTLIHFTDSVVTLYPKNNVSLFTVFRLARWCAYSPEIYTLFGKLDTTLLNNDFAKDLIAKKDKLASDSIAVAGKKPAGILQKAVTSTKIKGASAQTRVLVYWDDFSKPDRETTDEIKRLHLLYNNDALQINFVYTGSSDGWAALAKQAGLPDFANYLRCSKPDQTGNSPVVTSNDNTCLTAGLKGYNLYRKVSSTIQ